MLRKKGLEVYTGCNGQECLDLLGLLDKPATVKLDFVLLDKEMPVMDGHAAVERIRSKLGSWTGPEGACPLILGLTANVLVTHPSSSQALLTPLRTRTSANSSMLAQTT